MKNKKFLATAGMALILASAPVLGGCEQVLSDVLVSVLTGCEQAPVPTVKEGRFNFSVTYQLGEEVKTISSVFVCKYVESGMYLDGWYIEWDSYIEDSEIEALMNDESYDFGILVGSNEYGNIHLYLNLYAGYFMSQPGDDTRGFGVPSLSLRYKDELAEETGVYRETDPAVLESYGIKLISYEYDAPIENTYK